MGMVFALVAMGRTIIFGVIDIANVAPGEFIKLGTTVWKSCYSG
jgi:branched-subunit amino acid ABC-type transport system permease component